MINQTKEDPRIPRGRVLEVVGKHKHTFDDRVPQYWSTLEEPKEPKDEKKQDRKQDRKHPRDKRREKDEDKKPKEEKKPRYLATAVANEINHTHFNKNAKFIEVLHLLYVAATLESYNLRPAKHEKPGDFEKDLFKDIETAVKTMMEDGDFKPRTKLWEILAPKKYDVEASPSHMIYHDFEMVYNNLGTGRVALISLPIPVEVS